MDENKLIKVMDYIRRFSEENGYTPSVREIGAYCGIKAPQPCTAISNGCRKKAI